MQYLFIPIWAALQILFCLLFFSSFLEIRSRREEAAWIGVMAWLLTAFYGLFQVQGIYGYMMYLLSEVLVLLTVHGEYSGKGLCLLAIGFLIPVVTDLAAAQLAMPLTGLGRYLAVTAGKLLPVLLILLLRRLRLLPVGLQKNQDQDMLLLRQHMQMQQESMAALEQSYRLQRRSAHEFEHHMSVLRDLLDRGEAQAAREYLARLRKNRSIHVMNVSSNHPVIDVILNQKYQTARENEIHMQLRVNDLSAVQIPTDCLVVVLTNLLDNAIEACRRLDGCREIDCSILYDDGLFICVRNTSREVRMVDGKLPTTKQDPLSHGYGLLSVTYVLEELGAEYTYGYEEGWFRFAAEIE